MREEAVAGEVLSTAAVGWPTRGELPSRLDQVAGLGAEKFAERTAIIDGERSWSFTDLERETRRVAAALVEAGIEPGNRVGLLLTNRAEFFSTYFGIARAGAVAVPIGTRLSGSEVAFTLRHSETRLLMAERCQAERAQAGIEEAPGVELLDVDQLPEVVGEDTVNVPIDPDQDAAILYTSGTSDSPKGVRLTHRGIIHAAVVSAQRYRLTPEDVTLAVLPSYHSAVHFIPLPTLIGGGALVVKEGFRPVEALELLERHRVTLFPTVTAMAILIAKHVKSSGEAPRLDSLRRVFTGGAGVPDSLLPAWQEFAPRTGFANCFGLTEMGPSVCGLDPDIHQPKKDSVGPPYIGIEVRIADPDGATLPRGEVGEILVRGDSLMAGYLDNPEASAAALAGGWLHTGDLGRMDEDGYVYIAGREKHMIKRGGENVFPDEVEAVIIRHAEIKEVAVVPVPDEVMGERLAAILAPRAGLERIDFDSLIEHCRSDLAEFKVPELLALHAPELPKNSVGKLDLRRMRAMAADGSLEFVDYRRGRIRSAGGG